MTFQRVDLPYAYDALEPHIDARTMEIHYGKHHAGYTNNLNAVIEKTPEIADKSIGALLKDLGKVPESARTAVRNNGGGFFNHNLFWLVMSPDGGGAPSGPLGEAINAAFGDFASFKDTFSKAAATRFGSGWGWLSVKSDGGLTVTSSPIQDSPLSAGLTPILGVDVWEHAYYLHYQNRRADYLAAWWNLVNWDEVAKRFAG